MQVPIEIRFHNMDRSDAVAATVRERVESLERFADRIISCGVTIEAPHKHHRRGNLYRVAVDVRMPGSEVVASRYPDDNHAHEDLYVALRDAFRAARRQLQDRVRVQRRKVKAHETPPHGRIASLHAEKNFGRIATPDGREIYFHRNSLVNDDFDQLQPGIEVRFSEEMGDDGPQASTVHVIGKHHIVG